MTGMDKFYSRTGDDGFTGLLGEGRIPKYHPRAETIGALDEATSALGVARAACQDQKSSLVIVEVQRDLYHIMAEIAATPENADNFRHITGARVAWLEEQIDSITTIIELPREFILPGDSTAGASLALARAIVRRSERWVARLLHDREIENSELLRYINRLSSLCFVLELLENHVAGKGKPTLAKPPP